jgi:uncharacterized OB-fold protein
MNHGLRAPDGWSRSPRDTHEVFVSDVIGVDQQGNYALIGGRCTHCWRASFPLRDRCPHCQSPEPIPLPLEGDGAVYSFTVIRQAAPGFSVPYVLASADLKAGVRVIGQVAAAPAEVTIGTAVRLEVEPIGEDSTGRRVIGFRFHLSAEDQA